MQRIAFGLNFERHRPKAVELPQRPVRRGDKVRVLPPRGSTARGDQWLWQVKAIHRAKKTADLELLDAAKTETQTVPLDDLVVVAEFRDIIYPGLVSTGKVSRGSDKPFHTVTNGENYHALKALTWTHCGKVDAIYIDPPYHTGAKDWKYNNDFRHPNVFSDSMRCRIPSLRQQGQLIRMSVIFSLRSQTVPGKASHENGC